MSKIAFISTRSGYWDGTTLWFDKANGRLINQLLIAHPEMQVVAYRAASHKPVYNEAIATAQVRLMPETTSYVQGFRNTKEVSQLLKQLNAEFDVFIFQLPFHAFLALKQHKKPTVFHICANVVTAAQNPIKYAGWRKVLSQAIARQIDKGYRRQFAKRQNRVVTNGAELAELYKSYHPVATVSSSVMDAEYADAPRPEGPGSPLEVLFVGRPTLEKGVNLLVQALLALQARQRQVQLTFVGFTEAEFHQTNAHLELLGEQESLGQVQFEGVIPYGPELLARYRQADVLVLPSRNEGTPRVLIEARSQGCPVVATRVGGIPTSITDGEDGLLVPPEDADALADALESLMEDPELWQKLATQGLKRVRKWSVEKFSQIFEHELKELPTHGE